MSIYICVCVCTHIYVYTLGLPDGLVTAFPLFLAGDQGDNFYVIDSGYVDIFIESDTEEPKKVATHGPGGFFGELALMYGTPRAATVVVRPCYHRLSCVPLQAWLFLSLSLSLSPNCSPKKLHPVAGLLPTSQAATEVRLWGLDRATYRHVLLETTMKKRKIYESFLERVPLLSLWLDPISLF